MTVSGGSITIEGAQPWVPVMGTYNPSTGAFNAAGSGVVAGRSNIQVSFEGTIENGSLRGTVIWGRNGGLPTGQPIEFEVQGTAM